MDDKLRTLIQEEFARCTSPQDVAELYSEIKEENKKQMSYMLDAYINPNPLD